MRLWHLVVREIRHRKLNFSLALFSVTVAIGCLIGALTLLQADELRTEELLSARQEEVKEAGAQLKDAMRKITIGLGFNILILPEEQELNELHVDGTLSKTMPEEFVDRLANSRIVTVNHLLPIVTQKLDWEEGGQTIILTGTRGEVPQMHRDPKKPMLDAVQAGQIVIGKQIQQQQSLSVGDKLTLLGRQFEVAKIHPERGTVDDSTAWINLKEAQELLGRQNLVNAILALECNCATPDRLGEIRGELMEILPGTKVIERGPPALARAEARNQAEKSAKQAVEQEKTNRTQLRERREALASVLVPVVILAAAVWIGLLAFVNVRQRSPEIGMLRAIGLRSAQILLIFLSKAILIGLLGAGMGYALGLLSGVLWGDLPVAPATLRQLFVPTQLALSLVLAPLLAALASWMPAMLAARQDPALVLQEV